MWWTLNLHVVFYQMADFYFVCFCFFLNRTWLNFGSSLTECSVPAVSVQSPDHCFTVGSSTWHLNVYSRWLGFNTEINWSHTKPVCLNLSSQSEILPGLIWFDLVYFHEWFSVFEPWPPACLWRCRLVWLTDSVMVVCSLSTLDFNTTCSVLIFQMLIDLVVWFAFFKRF